MYAYLYKIIKLHQYKVHVFKKTIKNTQIELINRIIFCALRYVIPK